MPIVEREGKFYLVGAEVRQLIAEVRKVDRKRKRLLERIRRRKRKPL